MENRKCFILIGGLISSSYWGTGKTSRILSNHTFFKFIFEFVEVEVYLKCNNRIIELSIFQHFAWASSVIHSLNTKTRKQLEMTALLGIFLALALTSAVLAAPVNQYQHHSGNAMQSTCNGLMPGDKLHGHYPQTTIPPYTIEVSHANINPSDTIVVTMKGNQPADDFKGILIQARTQNNILPVGKFSSDTSGTLIDCEPGKEVYNNLWQIMSYISLMIFLNYRIHTCSSVVSLWTSRVFRGQLQVSGTVMKYISMLFSWRISRHSGVGRVRGRLILQLHKSNALLKICLNLRAMLSELVRNVNHLQFCINIRLFSNILLTSNEVPCFLRFKAKRRIYFRREIRALVIVFDSASLTMSTMQFKKRIFYVVFFDENLQWLRRCKTTSLVFLRITAVLNYAIYSIRIESVKTNFCFSLHH